MWLGSRISSEGVKMGIDILQYGFGVKSLWQAGRRGWQRLSLLDVAGAARGATTVSSRAPEPRNKSSSRSKSASVTPRPGNGGKGAEQNAHSGRQIRPTRWAMGTAGGK